MKTQLKFTFICTAIITSISISYSQNTKSKATLFDTKKFSEVSIIEDLHQYVEFIKETHPRIGYTTNERSLDSALVNIQQQVKDSLSVFEIWDLFARLNPIFNDAHVGLIAPENIYKEYLLSGGYQIPFSIKIKNGSIFLHDTNADTYDKYRDCKILSINGVKTTTILERLLPKIRGESRSLQELILAKRFQIFFTMYYGGYKEYSIQLKNSEGIVKKIAIKAKEIDGTDLKNNKENYYHFERLNDSIAYLKISSFDIENKEIFEQYLDNTFTEIFAGDISNLIIDIGENGGGARELSDLLLDYLTANKYTATSKVEARVTKDNKSLIPNANLGDVATVPFPSWVTPKNKTDVFKGNVYVLISKQTYSQAIVFATIVQDFNLGRIIGEETAGKANQTGQVQNIQLSHTGFTVYCPIYIFSRAKVVDDSRGVIPDIEVDYFKALEKAMSLINH
jgi:C-terminal processing protease CtpA/Prc